MDIITTSERCWFIILVRNMTEVIMGKYKIITDSCIDLPDQLAKELELEVIPMSVMVEGKVYYNHLDERDISFKDFYSLLREKKNATTAQLNPENFKVVWEDYLKEGTDILQISFSSALSGTYKASLMAKSEMEELYPERKIVVIDSKAASMGQGLLLYLSSHKKQEGLDIDKLAKWVEDNKLKVSHLFTVNDLNHLKRGGRLSSGRAFLGTLINIKPLLHVDSEGRLVQYGMARGRIQSLNKLISRIEETIVDPQDQEVFISHGDCIQDVEYVEKEIKKRLGVKAVRSHYIGPVIGSHSGPGTIAIFYLGNDRI